MGSYCTHQHCLIEHVRISLDRIYYTISNKTITISILPVCLYVIAKWYRESAEVGRVTLRIEDQKIREYQAEVKIGFEVQRGES